MSNTTVLSVYFSTFPQNQLWVWLIVLLDVARADRMQAKCSWREPGSGRPHGHVPKEEGGA